MEQLRRQKRHEEDGRLSTRGEEKTVAPPRPASGSSPGPGGSAKLSGNSGAKELQREAYSSAERTGRPQIMDFNHMSQRRCQGLPESEEGQRAQPIPQPSP